MTIKELRVNTGMTQKAFAEYFNIPVRTLQDWEHEKRTPPIYVVELIKYKLIKEGYKMKLVELNEGTRKELFEGNLEGIVNYLRENEDIYNWQLDEDPEAEMPELNNIETIADLEYELKKVDLSWWTLEIEL